MSRLYYEKQFRTDISLAEAEQKNDVSDYLTKVAQLVPAEIIAGYLTMIGFVGSVKGTQTQVIVLWLIFAFCLILTPLYLNKVADKGKPKKIHLFLSTLAFIVWAYVTSGQQLMDTIGPELYDQAIGSIVLVAFSLISALIPFKE